MLDAPDGEILDSVNDHDIEAFPQFARVSRSRDPPRIDDVGAATASAVDTLENLETLESGAEIGITAGSRGIHDMPAMLSGMVTRLQERGFEPFIFPAMGSHGGATAEGQRGTLESLGITEDAVGTEIRSSMAVEAVGEDSEGRPIYAAEDALEADAVLLANRVKLHTDFSGAIESGLCKMAVIGVGKQRGAESAHNAALTHSFRTVLPERTDVLLEETPIIGGLALLENANERAAVIEGVDSQDILECAPDLRERSEELFPRLPVEELDLLVLDEIGKNISGTGMDSNVVGRMRIHGEPEFDSPEITRIFVRDLTEETHGNANGIGLSDFAHQRAVEQINLSETYVNSITGGQPERAQIPVITPSDRIALLLAYSATGVQDPSELRIARIANTLEPDELLVSEPVAGELEGKPDIEVGELQPLEFEGEELSPVDYSSLE